jgi:hypothetical protein
MLLCCAYYKSRVAIVQPMTDIQDALFLLCPPERHSLFSKVPSSLLSLLALADCYSTSIQQATHFLCFLPYFVLCNVAAWHGMARSMSEVSPLASDWPIRAS